MALIQVYFISLLTLLVTDPGHGSADPLLTQHAGPRPLELVEVFKLFQIQYNRSYSNPAAPPDTLLSFPQNGQTFFLVGASGETLTSGGLNNHFLGPVSAVTPVEDTGKKYARRLDIFAHNLAQAQRMQEEDLGTAEFGVTPFSDLTAEEFGQIYGHQRAAERDPKMARKVMFEQWRESVPATCDWSKKANIISPIKNQKDCKCCWAIAAAGNIEALWGIRHQQPVEVSVQELLDCNRCGDGCEGGFVWDAYITVLNNSGLASEKDYPFQGHDGPHKCLAKKFKRVAWIQDFIMLTQNEQAIAGYLASYGPITVTINMKLLQNYQKGVIKATPTTCDPQHVDHSVLLVGFGKTKEGGLWAETISSQSHKPRRSIPYWILKNSWGDNWGEKGYFRLYRGNNACGITKYPLTARVGQPSKKLPVSCPP